MFSYRFKNLENTYSNKRGHTSYYVKIEPRNAEDTILLYLEDINSTYASHIIINGLHVNMIIKNHYVL